MPGTDKEPEKSSIGQPVDLTLPGFSIPSYKEPGSEIPGLYSLPNIRTFGITITATLSQLQSPAHSQVKGEGHLRVVMRSQWSTAGDTEHVETKSQQPLYSLPLRWR